MIILDTLELQPVRRKAPNKKRTGKMKIFEYYNSVLLVPESYGEKYFFPIFWGLIST